MKRLLVVVCLVWSFAALTPAVAETTAPTSITFYKSLIANIKSIKGTLLLSMAGGTGSWRSKGARNTFLVWNIDPSTTAVATIDYRDGVLQQADVKFSPPIHVWTAGRGRGFSIGIDSISYDQYGNANPHMWDDNHRSSNPNNPNDIEIIKYSLRLSRTADGILLGHPFANLTWAYRCSDVDGKTCDNTPQALITEVRAEKTDATHPGLAATFKDGALLVFSKKVNANTFDNKVSLKEGSQFNFSEIDYTPDDRHVFGVLDNMDLRISSGTLNTRDAGFVLGDGTYLHFDNVRFDKDGPNVTVDATGGDLRGGAAAGSVIALTTSTNNYSRLVLDDGSSVDLMGFGLAVDEQRHTTFSIGGGSIIEVRVRDGRLGIGRTGYIGLASGNLKAQLDGDWDSSAHDGPRCDLKILDLEAQLDGGILDLNGDSHLDIVSGAIKSTNLYLRSFEYAGLTGSVSELSVVLHEDSHFGVPGGVQLATLPGATITAANGTYPLIFDPALDFPLGRVDVVLPFSRLTNSKTPSLALTHGELKMTLWNEKDGAVYGENGSITGTASIATNGIALGLDLDMHKLSLKKAVGQYAEIDGLFSGRILPFAGIALTSPPQYHIKDHDDARLYPISFVMGMSAAATIPESPISFRNNLVELAGFDKQAIVVPVTMSLQIPEGRGEHQQPDDNDNTANGTHGPDDDKHRQELFTDTFPGCRVHLYLVADTYGISSKLMLSIGNGKVDVGLADINVNKPVGFDRDGCEVQNFLAIVASIVGGLLAGPVGSAVAAIVGFKEGESLDQMINDRIRSLFAEKIASSRFEWHFQL